MLLLLDSRAWAHAPVDPLGPSVEIATTSLEVKLRLSRCSAFVVLIGCCTIVDGISRANLIPSLRLLLHEVSSVDLGQASAKLTIRDHVEASVNLLGDTLVADLLERHLVQAFLLSQRFLLYLHVDSMLRLESLLLVSQALLSLIQPLLVIYLTINRVVKHAIRLHNLWKFLDNVLAMIFLFRCAIC